MRTLTDLSQLTKSMVKKSVEEPKPAPMPKAEVPTADREAAEVLAGVLAYSPRRSRAAKRAATRGANPATGELERRRAELKQILKDAGHFNDPKPLEKLGFKLISGRTNWKLQYANVRITMSKTPSDYRASLNMASDTANRCF